jgi:2-dehydro-3-deoxygluconokinase
VTRVLTLGETMGVAVTGPGEPLRVAHTARLHIAGAESTVAIGLRRLGLPACWLGVVGGDEFGARIRRELTAEGVDVESVRVDPTAPTGFMLRELRTAELTRVTYYRRDSAGARLRPADVDAAFERFGPDLVHLTGITAALSADAAAAVRQAVRRAADAGAEVSLDVNHRPSLPGSAAAAELTRALLPEVDVLFVGDDELGVLTDETDPGRAAERLAALGPGEVVVKRGAAGALAHAAGGQHGIDAWPVTVADVVGAGDSFVAGYLAARAADRPVAQRLRWGTICAAFTVGSHGDWEGLPTRAELERWDGTDGPAGTVR